MVIWVVVVLGLEQLDELLGVVEEGAFEVHLGRPACHPINAFRILSEGFPEIGLRRSDRHGDQLRADVEFLCLLGEIQGLLRLTSQKHDLDLAGLDFSKNRSKVGGSLGVFLEQQDI